MISSKLVAAASFLTLANFAAHASEVQSLHAVTGATVWFVEDHTVPMIAMEASLPAGSAYDPPGKSGLASFAGSLLDEGAAELDSKAFHDALANRAIDLTVTTERDYLEISLVCRSADANEAFHLLGVALRHARFDSDALVRVRAQMLEDVAEREGNPESAATKAFDATYFPGHPYGSDPDGNAAGINSVSSGDLRSFVRSHWVRGGSKIAISGDASAAGVSSLLASAFASLPGNAPIPAAPVSHIGKPGVKIVDMDVPQSHAVFGLAALPRSDPDYIASYVANYILGGGDFSSRLTNEIRVRRGLTYDISSELVSYRRASLIQGEVSTRRESIRQSIAEIRNVLRKYWLDGPTEKELEDAKTYLIGSFPLAFVSNVGIASQLASFQRQGLSTDYVTKRNALINAVSLDDVRRVTRRLFDPAHLTVVIAGTPGSAAAPAMSKH